jgi:hypothetical protein
METLEDLKTFLMGAGPLTLVFTASIALGYMLKTLPVFPNYLIPWVCVAFSSCALRFTQKITEEDCQKWFMPELRLYIVGALVGFAAWIAHNRFLKNWIDKSVWPEQPAGDSAKPNDNTMNKILTIAILATLCLSTSAQQGNPTLQPDSIIYDVSDGKVDEPAPPVFDSGEYQLELAGQARTVDIENYDKSVTVGANYWVTPGAGLHAAAGFNDANDRFVDRVEFGLNGRFSLARWNAALLFGVGAEWQRKTVSTPQPSDEEFPPVVSSRVDDWAVYAEAGPVFRLHRNVDAFAKVRGVRPIDGAEGEHIAFIAGLSLTGRSK